MALLRPFSFNGVSYPAAYTRVTSVILSAGGGAIYVGTYESAEARQRGDEILFHELYPTMPSQLVGDTYKLAYDHLRSRPEFEGATTYPDGDDLKPPADLPVAPTPAPAPEPEPTPDPDQPA